MCHSLVQLKGCTISAAPSSASPGVQEALAAEFAGAEGTSSPTPSSPSLLVAVCGAVGDKFDEILKPVEDCAGEAGPPRWAAALRISSRRQLALPEGLVRERLWLGASLGLEEAMNSPGSRTVLAPTLLINQHRGLGKRESCTPALAIYVMERHERFRTKISEFSVSLEET